MEVRGTAKGFNDPERLPRRFREWSVAEAHSARTRHLKGTCTLNKIADMVAVVYELIGAKPPLTAEQAKAELRRRFPGCSSGDIKRALDLFMDEIEEEVADIRAQFVTRKTIH